jgi:thymidylate kinase
MMVEFIGSTGAGKTTVAAAVQRRLAERAGVDTAPDFVASLIGLPPLATPLRRNLVGDLVGLPFFLVSLPRHGEFFRFVLGVLARQRLGLQAANRVRSTIRKVGVYEILRRRAPGRIVLVDEGTVLHAHNLFVFTSRAYSAADLDRFASLAPLPELIVYVRAPLATLVRRSLERPDPPREIRSRDRGLVELFVGRAHAMFETLVEIPVIRERVVVVDNPGDRAGASARAVEEVVESILQSARKVLGAPKWMSRV